MSRRTRRNYYRRRHRKSWSTRLVNFKGAQSAAAGTAYVIYQNLCQNPAQDINTVSNLYTVKNINCQVELENSENNASSIENLQAYIMYVPQGYIPTGVPSEYLNLPFDHPEWIMAHRYYGSCQNDTSGPQYPPLRLFSRLARKLDTGDRVILLIIGENSGTQYSRTLEYWGIVKFNTKAN